VIATYRIAGQFSAYRENVEGRAFLDVQSKDGLVHVRCSAALERALGEQTKLLQPGATVVIEYTVDDPVEEGRSLPVSCRCRRRAEFGRGER
jgi:hypothetical protein